MKNRVMVLFAHPSVERSEVNVELFKATAAAEQATLIDLYAEYPDYQIDIDLEQQRLLEHDVIVFMFPLYWYSTPALLKEWQDLVLEYGFAYGAEGTALQGKQLLCVLSAGGSFEAYCSSGANNYSVRELLRPLQQTATLCGMRFLPPFTLYSARTAVEEDRVHCHVDDWCRALEGLVKGDFETAPIDALERLNDALDVIPCAPPNT